MKTKIENPVALTLSSDRKLLQEAHDEIASFHGALARNDGTHNSVCVKIRAALAAPAELAYPVTLTQELAEVLGLQSVQACRIADVYRVAGHEIKHRAEDEQAFMIDRLVRMVLVHGAGWMDAYRTEVAGIRAVHAELTRQIEAKAKEIYEGWEFHTKYVPWQDGGNSHMQESARDRARAVIAASKTEGGAA